MAGVKRSHDGSTMDKASSSSYFMPMFETFRNELDEHYDRRERIIKASRDITALSKKMIFSLQRVHKLQADMPANVTKENTPRQSTINDLFKSIAPDLHDINSWRYQRQISGGVQEYMEAVSFQRYLETQRLIAYEEAQKTIPDGILLSEDDYLLGLFDLVGELMRFAITSMATTGQVPSGTSSIKVDDETKASSEELRDILTDLRLLRTRFEALDTTACTASGSFLGKDVEKKMEVMKTCVEKVEKAVYGMIIRGRERPKGWIPDLRDEERGRELGESY